jgi:hypothetical protein
MHGLEVSMAQHKILIYILGREIQVSEVEWTMPPENHSVELRKIGASFGYENVQPKLPSIGSSSLTWDHEHRL